MAGAIRLTTINQTCIVDSILAVVGYVFYLVVWL